MRIGVVYLGRRGAGGLISLNIALHLSQQADVFIVLSTFCENLPVWKASGLNLLLFETYTGALEAAWAWVDRRKIRQLVERVRAWKPDVLLFPMFYTWNPLLQQVLPDIPSVVAVHDPVPHPGLVDRVYKLLENRSMHLAKRCLVFSQAFIPEMQKRGALPDRLDVVPLGSLSYEKDAKGKTLEESLNPTQPKLLYFGRIEPYKGLDILLKAYRQVSSEFGVKLRIVGAGNLKPYLALLRDLPDVEVVNRWVGEDEIPSFFEPGTIVVLPYTSASQSGVIAVAASFGLPVIATKVGGIPEQIEDGETSILVEPGSVEDLVQALQLLLSDPVYAKLLGERLQNEYITLKSWDVISRKVLISCRRAMAA